MDMESRVIMMYGYPSTGKTFLAKRLGRSLRERYSVVNVATLDFRKKLNLFDLGSTEQRDLVYGLVAEEIQSRLQNQDQEVIIIDGNFNTRQRREKIYSVLEGAKIYIVHCFVSDEETIRKRMGERRKNPHIWENKASTMELYYFIRDSGDDINEDGIVRNGGAKLIRFNSERNVIDSLNLNEESKTDSFTREIISAMGE